ncbi:MAG TPA: methyltransferase [Symbiobacteriaceae bacterium]|nr:methyltransferase [Symbiobacteriaceae bacterium]
MNQWTEENSRQFLSFADVITPSRAEQIALLCRLAPFAPDQPFTVAELGCGGGDLGFALLQRFPQARYIGLDGSATMLESTQQKLCGFVERVSLRPFQLEAFDSLPAGVDLFVSSLVIHHLEHTAKAALYADLYRRLRPGGALLIADLVLPAAPGARQALSENWDEVARAQSQALTGSLATFEQFKREGWNYYSHPDEMDKPAPLFDQLKWLEQAGFRHVDCFWQRGGHAIYGGYR